MATQSRNVLTLKDRLSRLTYDQAAKLLKPRGDKLLRKGGFYTIEIDEQVKMTRNRFRLSLPDAEVELHLAPQKSKGLAWKCSCRTTSACEHIGAAFSLILEEKTPLGLAKEPLESVPAELLSEQALIEQAMEERRERAAKEKMRVKALDSRRLWSDYLVTNPASGKTYRVALRGWEPGDSFCSCPDFRKNTLGTCKHIMHVAAKVAKRFSAATCRKAYQQKEVALHLHYGEELELRFLLPEALDLNVKKIIGPLRQRPITNMSDLMGRLQKIERAGPPVLIYPDAEEYIQQHLFRQHIATLVETVRRNPESHPLRRNLLKVPLLPYQLDGIAFAIGAGRAILADEMGLGKTIQGIGVAELLAREAGIEKVLVICPASLKAQWREEIQRFCHRDSQIVIGAAGERAEQYENPVFFTLCNYEQVLRDAHYIEKQRWGLIILDEGQRIKNWEAKTSQTVKSLRSDFALVLTGTPLENRLDDLHSIMEFIDDRRLGPGFRFFHHHRVVDEKGKVLGYKNLGDLRKKLAPVLLRRTRNSVKQQLPERQTQVLRIPPTEEQVELHHGFRTIVSKLMAKRYLTEMDLLRLQKALLMCRMAADSTYLVDKQTPGFSSKLARLDELIEELIQEPDRKTIVFSEWTTMLDLIEPLLQKHNLDYVRLEGSVPQKKRQKLVQRFQTETDIRFFLTTNAGATGLNLQAANTVINVDLPWNPALLEQRIARAHRMGQKRQVQVYILVTENTLEENLLATLSSKKQLALAALDPDTDIDSVDFSSGLEELKKRLEILLGEKPEAPLEETRLEREQTLAARQVDIANAGGKLLTAAFQFFNQLLPETEDTPGSRKLAGELQQRLESCVQTAADGKAQLTINLPDKSVLAELSTTVARLMAAEVRGGE